MSIEGRNTLCVGQILNEKWVILEFIDKGGMGEVYRAHQLNLKRDVAIKVISRDWLISIEDDEAERDTGLLRFRREVQAMAHARHPNILQIFDYGSINVIINDSEEAVEYIAMEYVPGSTLRATMSDEGIVPDKKRTVIWLRKYFIPILKGVEGMHALDIIHRDLKPENILMDGDRPKIADFGLARSNRFKPVTQSIDVKGTISYMAPEQFFDFGNAHEQADVYSLGKILFEALTGTLTGKTQPLKKARLDKPETPFYQALDRIITRATEEEPDLRLSSVSEFRKALVVAIELQEDRNETPISTVLYSKWRWAGLSVFFVLLGAVLFWTWHTAGEPGKEKTHLEKQSAPKQENLTHATSNSANPWSAVMNLPRQVTAKDGVNLFLIPGGRITMPDNYGPNSGKTIDVTPFYMDETQVTNYQYAEFLNQVLSKIKVEKRTVQAKGKIWLLLGEVIEGYEPIIFQNKQFHVKNPSHAGCPVLRVTAFGASAYAHYYGRQLPTEAEWFLATQTSNITQNLPLKKLDNRGVTSTKNLTIHSPVMLFGPNTNGIRGINQLVSEWGLRMVKETASVSHDNMEYLILGGLGIDLDKNHKFPAPVLRQPWEGFENVGFRCVRKATDNEK